jgi:hypothetical protein
MLFMTTDSKILSGMFRREIGLSFSMLGGLHFGNAQTTACLKMRGTQHSKIELFIKWVIGFAKILQPILYKSGRIASDPTDFFTFSFCSSIQIFSTLTKRHQ